MEDYNRDGIIDYKDIIYYEDNYDLSNPNHPLYEKPRSYEEMYDDDDSEDEESGGYLSGYASRYSSSHSRYEKRKQIDEEYERKEEIKAKIAAIFVMIFAGIPMILFFEYYFGNIRFCHILNIILIIAIVHGTIALTINVIFQKRRKEYKINPIFIIIAFELVILASIPVIRFIYHYINYLVK